MLLKFRFILYLSLCCVFILFVALLLNIIVLVKYKYNKAGKEQLSVNFNLLSDYFQNNFIKHKFITFTQFRLFFYFIFNLTTFFILKKQQGLGGGGQSFLDESVLTNNLVQHLLEYFASRLTDRRTDKHSFIYNQKQIYFIEQKLQFNLG